MKVYIGPFKKNKNRKVKVKIHDYDIWNADDTLIYIMLPLLKKLKKSKLGFPIVDDCDVPENLWDDTDKDEVLYERWQYVINQIIYSLNELHPKTDWTSRYHTGIHDWKFADNKMIPGPKHTAKFDSVGYDENDEKINRGLLLLGKYFRSLWT
jgi:hypothetical protein